MVWKEVKTTRLRRIHDDSKIFFYYLSIASVNQVTKFLFM